MPNNVNIYIACMSILYTHQHSISSRYNKNDLSQTSYELNYLHMHAQAKKLRYIVTYVKVENWMPVKTSSHFERLS